jgi:predicted membrane protein (TIGR00267 family)
MKNKINFLESLREIVFGFEDGIVSTMGVIIGIASGTQNKFTVILAGLVVISVESLSMAAGIYLSNKTEEEFLASNSKNSLHARLHRQSLKGVKSDALFMGLAYILGGSIPLLPYFLFSVKTGILFSILFSLIGLLSIGVWKSKITHTSSLKGALEMAIISLSAAGVGYFIGKLVSIAYPQLNSI